MKILVFDTGPIISLTTNNLLWILKELKNSFQGSFAITQSVKKELIDKPLETKQFKFEAIQIQELIEKNIISLMSDLSIEKKAEELLAIANRIIWGHGHPIEIVQRGEMEAIAAALINNANAVAIDERVTRTLIENPKELHKVMEKRLHMQLKVDDKSLHAFVEKTRHLKVIRSIELVTIAYEKGLLDQYIVKIPDAKKNLLESVLWGVKLHGCSVTEEEINTIVKSEKF